MSFLTPLFLLGLAGLAVPVVIHLIQRERKNVVQFPSLMFLQRIPYQSVRRRRIRNWPLLLLRIAALVLVVLAFARPFFRRAPVAAAAGGGARELVVLVDTSYSMGYGDRWVRAVAGARAVVGTLASGDRASIVFFASGADVALRSTSDRGRLEAAIAAGKPGASATHYGPALKLAGSILSESALPRREVVLVSDFQRSGWPGTEGVRLPDGATLTPVAITDPDPVNLSVTPVSLQRTTFSDQDRVTVTGGAVNHGSRPLKNVELSLEVDGRSIQKAHVDLEPGGSASVSFDPFTPAAVNTRGTVRLGADPLQADNAFNFIVSPKQPLRIVVAERPGAPRDASLYLSRALALGQTPPFDVAIKSIEAVGVDDLQRAAIVVVNDAPVSALLAGRLAPFVERGGGVLLVAGPRTSWPGDGADFLPAVPGAPVDRTAPPSARLGALEYGNPIFEPFRAPRSGDFSAARFYGYRAATVAPDAQIVARFDDGSPALVERRIGTGRVLVWTSTLDMVWNDLALKPVFLPFVHRVATRLASYIERPAWVTVGEVFDPAPDGAAAQGGRAAAKTAGRVVLAPSGQRVTLDSEGPDVLEIGEAGFYEVRGQGRDGDPPLTVASNVDLGESDLATMDPQDVVAGAMGRAGGAAPVTANATATADEQERTQRIWWYLLFAGLLLLGVETVVASRDVARVRV